MSSGRVVCHQSTPVGSNYSPNPLLTWQTSTASCSYGRGATTATESLVEVLWFPSSHQSLWVISTTTPTILIVGIFVWDACSPSTTPPESGSRCGVYPPWVWLPFQANLSNRGVFDFLVCIHWGTTFEVVCWATVRAPVGRTSTPLWGTPWGPSRRKVVDI